MWHEVRLFFVALRERTRLPVPGWVGDRPEWRLASARHAPAAGALVGTFGAAALWAAAHLWPAAVAVGAAMLAMLWLTGARPERALARACDGFAGAPPRPGADAPLGAAGAVGLIAVLAMKAAALHGLAVRDFDAVLVALPFAQAVSHGVAALLAHRAPAADAAPAVVVAGCGVAGAAAVALGIDALQVVPALLAAAGVGLALARAPGGPADAAQPLAEVAAYLALLAALSHA